MDCDNLEYIYRMIFHVKHCKDHLKPGLIIHRILEAN